MLARLRPSLLLFLGLNVIYHANLRPIDGSDSLPASLVPFSVALDHSLTLDRFDPWLRAQVWYAPSILSRAHGHVFSSYPIGSALLISPFYLPAAAFGVARWDPGSLVVLARIAQKFAAAAIAAFSAVLLWLLLKRIVTLRWAWILTLVYALGTETWSISSQALWQHGAANLAIVAAFLCFDIWCENRERGTWLWLCGASVGAAFIVRPTNLVFVPAILAAMLMARAAPGQYLRLLAPVALCALLIAGYNEYVFQNLSGGYAVGLLTGSPIAGLAGIFLSPGRGLLIYTPVAIFALYAFARTSAPARRERLPLFTAAVVFIVLDSFAIGRAMIWWGGYTWGPRLLTELAPPLVILMAIGVRAIDRPWPRRIFAALAVYSVMIQALGAFFYPNGHWDAGPPSVDASSARLWDWRDNPIVRTARGGFYWQPYAVVGAAMTGGLSGAERRVRELNVNPFEQAQPDKPSRARPSSNPGLP